MAPDMTDPSELPTLDAHTQSMEMIAETLALYSTIQSLDGPRAKDYISDLIIPEDYVASGLNFGSIYSELVHQKDYPNYTFVAGDFEALDVTIDSNDTYSLDDAGVTVSPDGDITIDTNKNVYQPFNDGDLINTSIAFRVTDNNNLSDIGSVKLVVAGKDERISDGWQGGKELINDVVGDLLGQYAAGDAISTILDTQGNKSNISFDFYSVGSWDSENFVVKTDNDIIFEQDFQASNPFSGSREGVTTIDGKAFQWSIESNGRDHYGLGRFTQKASVEVDMPSGLQNINLTLTSDVDGGVNDESWAVNNFNFNIPPSISLDQRHTDVSGGDFLKLGYALKGNDDTGNPGGDASDLGVDSSGLTNVAVLGPNTSDNKTYTLEISAESLNNAWDLESADIVLKYDTQLFEKIDTGDITLGNHLTLDKGIVVDDENGLIRIAAASLSDTIFNQGDSIGSEAIFASINVDFDESYFKDSERIIDANGKFTFEGNPLGFELSANSDSTVFSRTFTSDADGSEVAGGSFTNREIQSLGDLKGNTTFDEGKVNLYQAEIKFQEQGDGLVLGTKRIIGSETGFTNLIRKGDLISAKTNIENIGNSLAKDVLIEDAGNVAGASFEGSRFLKKFSKGETSNVDPNSQVDLKGGEFKSQLANTDNANIFQIPFIRDLETKTEVTDVVRPGNGYSIVDGDLVSTHIITEAHTFSDDLDLGNIGYETNILLFGNQFATNAALQAAIRSMMRSGGTLSAQDAFLAAYSDGTHSHLVQVDLPAFVPDDAVLAEARVSTIQTFDGMSDINALSNPGAFAGIINDAQPIDYPYDPSTQESTEIEIDVRITGEAGDVVDLTKGLFKVSAEDTEQNPNEDDQYYLSNKGSKNLITFQGDLNYDGRVSMKDLAYLNAGAARQQQVTIENAGDEAVDLEGDGIVDASVARDVDADFSGKIDLADLSILDADWGKSLHTGDQDFQGSGDVSWSELDSQGESSTWNNDSFKDQNAIEAEDAYIGSLETTVATGDIGANTGNNTDPMTGANDQYDASQEG